MATKDVSYAIPQQLVNFLNLSSLTASTTPSLPQVKQFIHQAEREIERRTLHAWRDVRFSMEYDFPEEAFTNYRTHGYSLWFDGIEIPLQHRDLRDLDAAMGDSLTVREGGTRVDYIGSKSEGINSDYFLEPRRGILHIYKRWAIQIHDKVRVTFRYGTKAQGVVASATSDNITVDNTDNFQPGLAYVYQDNSGSPLYEAVYIDSMSATVLTVARAQEGTTELTLGAGDIVWQVPEDIQKACIRLASIEIAHNDTLMTNISLGEGMDYEGIQSRVDTWRNEVEDILERRTEIVRI